MVNSFLFFFLCSSFLTARALTDSGLWRTCYSFTTRKVANENSRRSSRTKTLSAPIRQRVARTGDTERRREGGTEAPGVLTGQLEGANLLSERNIPDRVGMQQGDGRSGGLGEEAPSGAPWGC